VTEALVIDLPLHVASAEPGAGGHPSLRTATITAAFCMVAAGLYAAVDREPSPEVAFFFSVAPLFAVIIGKRADDRAGGWPRCSSA
jgi:hypothetical protein